MPQQLEATKPNKTMKGSRRATVAKLPDGELCGRVNGGDEQAFSEVYNRYEGLLQRYLLSRVPDRDTVADLVSDVFLKTWQFLKLGGRITYLPAFLFRSAKNILNDWFRHKRTHGTIPFSAIEGTKLERVLISPKEELAQNIDRTMALERFTALTQELPDRQRMVITLRYIEGMKTKEIAEAVQLSHANTRVLLHRGLATIRKRYGGELSPLLGEEAHRLQAASGVLSSRSL